MHNNVIVERRHARRPRVSSRALARQPISTRVLFAQPISAQFDCQFQVPFLSKKLSKSRFFAIISYNLAPIRKIQTVLDWKLNSAFNDYKNILF